MKTRKYIKTNNVAIGKGAAINVTCGKCCLLIGENTDTDYPAQSYFVNLANIFRADLKNHKHLAKILHEVIKAILDDPTIPKEIGLRE